MSAAARKTLRTLLLSGLVSLAAVGCARQSEGERCDLQANGSNDCDEGLRCVLRSRLADDTVDRCCPRFEDAPISDSRCTPRSGTAMGGRAGANTGGSGGGAGAPPNGGTDSGGNGGTDSGGTDSGGNAGQAPAESGAGGE